MEFSDNNEGDDRKKGSSDLAINVGGYQLGLVKKDPSGAVSDLSGEGMPSSNQGLFIKATYVDFVSDLSGYGTEERGTLHTTFCTLTQEKDKVRQQELTFPGVKTNTYKNPVRESFEANFVPVRLLEPGARALCNADNIAPEGITVGTLLTFCDGQTAWLPVPLTTMEEAVNQQQVEQAAAQKEFRAELANRIHETLIQDGIEASYAVEESSPWVPYETLEIGSKERVEVEKAGLIRTKTRTVNERVTSRAPGKVDARMVKMIHGLQNEVEQPEAGGKGTPLSVVTFDTLGGSISVVVDREGVSENPFDVVREKFDQFGVAFASASYVDNGKESTVLFNPDLFKPGLPKMREVTRIRFKERPENVIEPGEKQKKVVCLPQKELLVLGDVRKVFAYAAKKFEARVTGAEIDVIATDAALSLPDVSAEIEPYEPPKSRGKAAKFQHKPA